MPAVVLKGHKEGYEFLLNDACAFADIRREIGEILDRIQNETISRGDKLTFSLNTGNRLLDAGQREEIEKIFEEYPRFSIRRLESAVDSREKFAEFLDERTIHPCGEIIRNGQIREIRGDVMFCGSVHEGGILRATGSIFILGNVEGIIHAGSGNDSMAVIAGNVSHAQQVRIADLVQVVSDEDYENRQKLVYVNDLHALDVADVTELKVIRPKIFTQNGGMI